MKKCPYCAEEVQDDALICKHCKSNLQNHSTQTIELTGKKYKKQYLWCFLMFFVGIVMGGMGFGEGSNVVGIIGSVLLLASIILIIATKAQVWWHHK